MCLKDFHYLNQFLSKISNIPVITEPRSVRNSDSELVQKFKIFSVPVGFGLKVMNGQKANHSTGTKMQIRRWQQFRQKTVATLANVAKLTKHIIANAGDILLKMNCFK